MRLVLDTAAFIAALRSEAGASRRLLIAALERRLTLVVSVPLMIEYEAVALRPEHLDRSGLTVGEVGVLLDAVAAVAEPIRLAFLWRPILRDANDDMVLETAVNGRADGIVTFNTRDFADTPARFGIDLSSPGEAWARLEAGR
ncbi:putative toxin-antitoxin system toxin component, PIN family [Zavarzinia aquatilis]|uniref:Putative toxin-antitoxin system toxin component, PIN family n=1 Tax=Zavarzinia aquatilis TaxID=2211142 RepID=A0A317E469_9PROT|nr:putative toxin-antitoxin system toxin component, PIN family [Zavarzinia aquatilis]PWR20203.1 putative toxin-antitoxin system toxin component, PIN family [Zavarzinia aquatilis]